MKLFNDIRQIADNYQYFIIDIWGVVHDGSDAYEDVLENLRYLRDCSKNICFLSNAPRKADVVADVLAKFGVDDSFYDFVLSSGQAVFNYLKENDFGKNYYYIGPKKDEDLLKGLQYERVYDANIADFAIVTGYDDNDSVADEKDEDLKAIKAGNLTLICVNPDLVVVKQDGRRLICAGLIAQRYQEMQGKVVYFGKPYKMVYDQVFKLFDVDQNSAKKVLAIGDGLETDIKGANDFGIDCAFVSCGIFGSQLKVSYGQLPEIGLLKEICQKNQANPDYVISKL